MAKERLSHDEIIALANNDINTDGRDMAERRMERSTGKDNRATHKDSYQGIKTSDNDKVEDYKSVLKKNGNSRDPANKPPRKANGDEKPDWVKNERKIDVASIGRRRSTRKQQTNSKDNIEWSDKVKCGRHIDVQKSKKSDDSQSKTLAKKEDGTVWNVKLKSTK